MPRAAAFRAADDSQTLAVNLVAIYGRSANHSRSPDVAGDDRSIQTVQMGSICHRLQTMRNLIS
jgi:hypothetical protein